MPLAVDDPHESTTVMVDDRHDDHRHATFSRPQSQSPRVIGGTRGHITETMHPLKHHAWLRLFDSFRWKMIPRCTGRYTCRDHARVSQLSPLELLESVGMTTDTTTATYTFRLEGRKDPILVLPLDGAHETGIITYVKETTSGGADEHEENEQNRNPYVHTLNSPSGFQRKLEAIGIYDLSSSYEMKFNTS